MSVRLVRLGGRVTVEPGRIEVRFAEFTEIESGRRDTNRPQLHAALGECRKRGATLLIARRDRLARNVAFIANLMDSGTEFVAVGRPPGRPCTSSPPSPNTSER